jgi:hypothetical protein
MGAAENVATKIADGWKWVGQHLLPGGEYTTHALGEYWEAEHAWAKRHPTIAAVGAGVLGALVAGAVAAYAAPAVAASAGVALVPAALAMLVGGVGGVGGAAASYFTKIHLTGEKFSPGELLRTTALTGGLGVLTAGLSLVVAEAITPLVASVVASPAAQKVVTEVVADAGANAAMNGTVAAQSKVIENVAKNYGEGKPLLQGATDGVATEVAEQTATAAGSAIAAKVIPALPGAAGRALKPAPEEVGFTQILDGGAPLGDAAAPEAPQAPVEPSSPAARPELDAPLGEAPANAPSSEKSPAAHGIENEPLGGEEAPPLPEQPVPGRRLPLVNETNCFPAGTLVETESGLRPIEAVRAGEHVVSAPENGGRRELKRVTRLFRSFTDRLAVVSVLALAGSPETLRATPNHPFFVAQRGWVQAGELHAGDVLESERGEPLVVGRVELERANVATFNFEVEDDHTYFVAERAGAPAVWVHNQCKILAEVDYVDSKADELVAMSKDSTKAKLLQRHRYTNPGAHDPTNNPANTNRYDPTKSVLPENHVDLFKKSIPVKDPETGRITRWTKEGTGKRAVYHRFQAQENGVYHWNGSTAGVTQSGQPREIPMNKVPEEVQRHGE